MTEIYLFESQKRKMQELCENHKLTFDFQSDNYPITFTISPEQDSEDQMSMLSDNECGRSPAASMTWKFADGDFEIETQGGTFTISKALRSKIEGILTKMISYWQQYFFYDVMTARRILNARTAPFASKNDEDGYGEHGE